MVGSDGELIKPISFNSLEQVNNQAFAADRRPFIALRKSKNAGLYIVSLMERSVGNRTTAVTPGGKSECKKAVLISNDSHTKSQTEIKVNTILKLSREGVLDEIPSLIADGSSLAIC